MDANGRLAETYRSKYALNTEELGRAAWQAHVAFGGIAIDGATKWEMVAVAVVAAIIRTHRLEPVERCKDETAKPST